MTLRVAFVGAGFMAQTHAGVLSREPEISPVAVCANGSPSAGAFATRYGGAVRVFDDYVEMLDDAKPDAVYICIPPFAHRDEVGQAAARGIHVFVEKPIALDVAAAESMVDAAEQAGIVSQVGFQMRFHPAVEALKQLMDEGRAGTPVVFTGRYWTNMEGKTWWRDRERSGGQILEQVIHLYDLAAHLMGGSDLAAARGHLANVAHREDAEYRIEDLSLGLLPHPGGGLSIINGCNAVRRDHFIADFRAVFSEACLDYRCSGQPWVEPDQATLIADQAVVGQWTGPVDLWVAINRDFIGAIRHSRAARVPLADGLRALKWVKAVTGNPLFA